MLGCVFEICEQTDILIAILRTRIGGEVIKNNDENGNNINRQNWSIISG